MPIVSVVVSRAELGLPPLELSTDPDCATYWLARTPSRWPPPGEAMVPRPRDPDRAEPPSPVLLPPVLALEVLVGGASAADLYAARGVLAQVLAQRAFELIVVRPRRESRHRAGPSVPVWSAAAPPAGAGRGLRARLRIPLYDLPGPVPVGTAPVSAASARPAPARLG